MAQINATLANTELTEISADPELLGYAKNKGAEVDRIVRVMIFLHSPQPGHQLWIEDKYCTGPAGTWFSWQGATKHMAANLGETDRYVIQITGWV